VRARRWWRALLPAALILGWFVVAGVGGPYFGKISEVAVNDQAAYLPESAESTRVNELRAEFSEGDAIPAIVLFVREGGLTDADTDFATRVASDLGSLPGLDGEASPPIPSEDGDAVELFVPVASDGVVDTIDALREAIAADAPPGLAHYVTGPAGFTADLVDAFRGIDGILLLTALAAVLVILIIVYRSPVLPLLVLGTSLFALCASILVVWWLAKDGVLLLNGQVQGILFILVIGAATDYSLLYVSRFREALRDVEGRWEATLVAVKGSLPAIVASGGTVIAGLLCLLLSDLRSNQALGPVGALGIGFSILAALTLLPALLLACGRASFWPLRPMLGSAHPETRSKGLWAAATRLVSRRARAVWIICVLALIAGAAGVLQLQANGVPQSDLVLGNSQARDGQEALGLHFPGGSGSPAVVIGSEDRLQELADAATGVDGVDGVSYVSSDSPSGTVPLDLVDRFPPTVVDGQVQLQATLSDAADSDAAKGAVLELRSAVHEVDPDSIVGGVTAVALDTDATSIQDRTLIIPVVLVVILAILMVLLRSIVAPVLLILTVILSYFTALGVSALVFNQLLGFPGADPAVPLYGFVFLVALGIDYNIFLMTRVREESVRHGSREGILRGLAMTGGVITSAGLVLAATFAALGVIPILFLAQIAFIVAFGVLLDTIVVRSLLVPALGYDIGRAIWWPSKLSRPTHVEAGTASEAR
jgi:RND superfamily putative drug exporter